MVSLVDKQTGGITNVLSLTLSLDTNAYADGDLLADVQELASATRIDVGTGIIQTLTVIDKDDQGGALDVYFTSVATTWGTENSAPTITDAVAASIQGSVSVTSADYYDLGGVRVAHINSIGMPVKSPSNSDSLYVAVIGRATATYTASGIVLNIGILID